MPTSYVKRKQRREQLAEDLPPDLRERIALRHVETVSQFSPEAQCTLAEVLDAGVPAHAVIAYLKRNPTASTAEVIEHCRNRKGIPKGENGKPEGGDKATKTAHGGKYPDSSAVRTDLADIIAYCYPDMPRITAEAMAGSDLLSGVRQIIQAQQACFAGPHVETDFVLVVLCGLAQKTVDRLGQIASQKLIYRQALQQSGVHWRGFVGAGRGSPDSTGKH